MTANGRGFEQRLGRLSLASRFVSIRLELTCILLTPATDMLVTLWAHVGVALSTTRLRRSLCPADDISDRMRIIATGKLVAAGSNKTRARVRLVSDFTPASGADLALTGFTCRTPYTPQGSLPFQVRLSLRDQAAFRLDHLGYF